jgi:hypothetical protein
MKSLNSGVTVNAKKRNIETRLARMVAAWLVGDFVKCYRRNNDLSPSEFPARWFERVRKRLDKRQTCMYNTNKQGETMEGYKRIVVEVPVSVKESLESLAKWRDVSIKECLIDLIKGEYLKYLDSGKGPFDIQYDD